MKETNMEHYRSEIEAVSYNFAFERNKIVACDNSVRDVCKKCLFNKMEELSCASESVKWLMSEYKPVLTAREKHFVEFAQDGWIARDENGELWWYDVKPEKKVYKWITEKPAYRFNRGIFNFEQCFRFITWEDEEPWSVEELRKLKVQE